jgi:hypothetical protein
MTITVRNFKIRSASRRRYIVVIVQPHDRTTVVAQWDRDTASMVSKPMTIPAGASIHKRSDDITVARAHARRFGFQTGGAFAVVVDTVTGSEV